MKKPAAVLQASAGRINIQPGLPAKDTASQPGHTAQNGARAVLMGWESSAPSCLLALQAREVVGQPDPADLTSLRLLHK